MYTRARNRTIKKNPQNSWKPVTNKWSHICPFLLLSIIQCEQNMKKSHKRRPAQFVDDMTVIL